MDILMSAIDVVINSVNLHTSTDVVLSAGIVEFYILKNIKLLVCLNCI